MKLIALTLAALATAPFARGQIFADVETEDHGRFTMQLDQLWSPAAVANFIRLVEGTQPWIDEDGIVRVAEPFYEGLKFHSVTPGIEIVTGSRSGNGSDGPGYLFRDDFRSGNVGQSPPSIYSVYMENDGPNTNGSRFFIHRPSPIDPVLRPGNYTRFGIVLTGTNPPGQAGQLNVLAMSNTADDAVEIESITIRRQGLLADSFDEFSPTWELPSVETAVLSYRRTAGTLFLDWDTTPGSSLTLYNSFNLQNWAGPLMLSNAPGGSTFGFDLTSTIATNPQLFLRGATVRYDAWPSTQRPLVNASVEANFNGSFYKVRYNFDGSGASGSWQSFVGQALTGSGDIEEVQFEPTGPYTSTLFVRSEDLATYSFVLHYDVDGTTFTTTNPSRHRAKEFDESGEKAVQTGEFDGLWTYVAP